MMDVLPVQFRVLRFFGLWRESTERRRFLAEYIWKPLSINVMVFFTLSQVAATRIYRHSMSDLTQCLFVSLTYVTLCFKLINFLLRRGTMRELLGEFRDRRYFAPRNDDERVVLVNCRKLIGALFVVLAGISQSTALTFDLLPLIPLVTSSGRRDFDMALPFKTYEIQHRDEDYLVYYVATYVFQVFAPIVGILVNVSFDTMFSGFVLLVCQQIDFCRRRFLAGCEAARCEEDRRRTTIECAIHLQSIRRVVKRIESFFMCVVVPLLLFSLITLCTSIYNISQTKIGGVESFSFLMYLGCLLCQIFFYCWFGNELKLKSATICETIYRCDWTAFEPVERKNLYFMMLASQKSMILSYHGLCPITLEIYIWVLKTSYAAYNLLKTVEASSG